jgi:hypothetical protein
MSAPFTPEQEERIAEIVLNMTGLHLVGYRAPDLAFYEPSSALQKLAEVTRAAFPHTPELGSSEGQQSPAGDEDA